MAQYSVAVDIELKTAAFMSAIALITGAAGLGAVASAVAGIEKSFAGWAGVLVGGAGFVGGATVLGALKMVSDQAVKTADQIAVMKLGNYPAAETQSAIKFAQDVGMKVGVAPDVSQEVLNKLLGVVNTLDKAKPILEPMLRMGVMLESLTKGKQGMEQIVPIARMLEETHILTDPGRRGDVPKTLERIARAMAVQPGTINPQQLQLSTVYARSARFGFTSPEALQEAHPFMTDILPYYASMSGKAGQGGGGAGLMSMYTKTVMGIMDKKTKEFAASIDMLDPKTGGFREAHLAAVNPYEWSQQVLAPRLKEHLGITDSLKQQPEIAKAIAQLFRTRLAADPPTEFVTGGRFFRGEESPFEQHMKRMDRYSGLESAEKLQATSPTAAMNRLTAEWEHLWNIIGGALTEDRIRIIRSVADAIEALAKKAQGIDPQKIVDTAEALAKLSVAVMAGGGVAVLLGPIPGLITTLGVALLETSPKLREFVSTGLQGIASAAADATKALTPFLNKLHEIGLSLGIVSARTPYHDTHPGLPRGGIHPPAGGWSAPIPGGREGLPGLHPGDLLKRSSYEPGGGGGKSLAVNNVIYLDGSAIARAVHDYMIAGVEHPVQAPQFDGRDGYTSPDHQPIRSA